MKSISIQLAHKSSRVEFPETTSGYDTPDNTRDSVGTNRSLSAVVIYDSNTVTLFPETDRPFYVLPAGEEYKNSELLLEITDWALSVGATRDTHFIAVGGGVVCDITAFAASIYMRGVPLILVPTTLLSMVDASLGGKTGIDFKGYKNILGSFYPAERIRIYPEVLGKLPEREYLSGLAEVIKHALLRDTELLRILRNEKERIIARDPEVLSDIIYRSQLVKQWYIEQDPYDLDVRGHLNFGHTFGHALESIGGLNTWSHGEAVAWGMGRAMVLGRLLGLTSKEYAEQVIELLKAYGYNTGPRKSDAELILEAMEKDKKKKAGRVRFILQSGHAQTSYQVPERDIVLRSLTEDLPV
ncbi:MAG: 3-dehydroquinate synthase [Spirochaetota bacterium]